MIGSVSSTCGGEPQGYATASNKKRIVVIGAGLAGLAAAQELHRQGHEVVVVEARDRLGGLFRSAHGVYLSGLRAAKEILRNGRALDS